MKAMQAKVFALIVAVGLMFSGFSAPATAADKPFAQEKVVLQISDPNPFKQTLVLNVAHNLLKHYGQDSVAVEIVAFGPGLRLLMKNNANSNRIAGLAGAGVRFSACGNTIHAFAKKLGHTPVLNSHAVTVSGGVARIVDLEKQGYVLVKP